MIDFRQGIGQRLLKLATLAAAISLSACSQFSDERAEARRTLQHALAAAEKADGPWARFEILERADTQVSRLCEPESRYSAGPCGGMPEENKVRELLAQNLKAAVDANAPGAIVRVLTWHYRHPLAPLASHKVLALADGPSVGPPHERAILWLAGREIAKGEVVIANANKALALFARAAALGEHQAAGDAARMLLKMNDPRNAYLWSLRCIAPCQRTSEIELDRLQERMSPAAALQTQAIAQDFTVLELDLQ